jgi:hypothetical protein
LSGVINYRHAYRESDVAQTWTTALSDLFTRGHMSQGYLFHGPPGIMDIVKEVTQSHDARAASDDPPLDDDASLIAELDAIHKREPFGLQWLDWDDDYPLDETPTIRDFMANNYGARHPVNLRFFGPQTAVIAACCVLSWADHRVQEFAAERGLSAQHYLGLHIGVLKRRFALYTQPWEFVLGVDGRVRQEIYGGVVE